LSGRFWAFTASQRMSPFCYPSSPKELSVYEEYTVIPYRNAELLCMESAFLGSSDFSYIEYSLIIFSSNSSLLSRKYRSQSLWKFGSSAVFQARPLHTNDIFSVSHKGFNQLAERISWPEIIRFESRFFEICSFFS